MLDRLFNFSGAAFLIGMVVIAAALAFDALSNGEDTIYQGESSIVAHEPVRIADGEALFDIVGLCGDVPVGVSFALVWTRFNSGEIEDVLVGLDDVATTSTDCLLRRVSLPLPDEIVPGTWTMRSTVTEIGDSRTESVTSEPFQVVP